VGSDSAIPQRLAAVPNVLCPDLWLLLLPDLDADVPGARARLLLHGTEPLRRRADGGLYDCRSHRRHRHRQVDRSLWTPSWARADGWLGVCLRSSVYDYRRAGAGPGHRGAAAGGRRRLERVLPRRGLGDVPGHCGSQRRRGQRVHEHGRAGGRVSFAADSRTDRATVWRLESRPGGQRRAVSGGRGVLGVHRSAQAERRHPPSHPQSRRPSSRNMPSR